MGPTIAARKEPDPHRVPVGRTLLIAGVCALIPLLGNVGASFVTEWTGGRSWLVVPAVGVLVAMVTALVQAYGAAPSSRRPPQPVDHDAWVADVPDYSRYGRRPGVSLPVALIVAIVVVGVGGLALTFGVRYVVGYVTGNEPGTERLLAPASASKGGLTLTVESVQHTAHFTRVRVVARNTSNLSMTLPLFKNCAFRANLTSLEASPFKSRWTEELPPGAAQRGTITFDGHVGDAVRQAELSFSRVFSFGPGGPDTITVTGIELRPL